MSNPHTDKILWVILTLVGVLTTGATLVLAIRDELGLKLAGQDGIMSEITRSATDREMFRITKQALITYAIFSTLPFLPGMVGTPYYHLVVERNMTLIGLQGLLILNSIRDLVSRARVMRMDRHKKREEAFNKQLREVLQERNPE